MIRPIPEQHGVGFTTYERKPEYASRYREEQTGRYWNYYFTPFAFDWPEVKVSIPPVTIDGFSPNLNKKLHVGHLRNLATARSLTRILDLFTPVRIVSLLGASQGVQSTAVVEYNKWCEFLNYKPELFYDVLQPWDYVTCRPADPKDNEHFSFDKPPTGCKMFDGPKGPVIVVRSDGRPTYGFYDLAFSKNVNPTHYITGDEQISHWAGLGMGEKHLPMGLVLGKDGKKMKSRTGDSPTATEIIDQIIERLKESADPERLPDFDRLAWNVAAWNFLHTARSHTVKFDLETWTHPDQAGLYITYTYARLMSALGEDAHKELPHYLTEKCRDYVTNGRGSPGMLSVFAEDYLDKLAEWSQRFPDPEYDLTIFDVELLGTAAYAKFYLERCVDGMDPAPLANYAQVLAKKLNAAYHHEKIKGGRYGFRYAVSSSTAVLRRVMNLLGMFPLEKV